MDEQRAEDHRVAVARRLVAVGRSLDAFNFGERQYLPKAVDEAMREAERAFSAGVERERSKDPDERALADVDYARAGHLAKVVAIMVCREAPRFAADPERWITERRGPQEVKDAKRESARKKRRERRHALELIRERRAGKSTAAAIEAVAKAGKP